MFVSKGEVFVNAEGETTTECFNFYKNKDGSQIYLRIGNNVYFFYDGEYDGSEHKMPNEKAATIVADLLEKTRENRGQQPDDDYFPVGSPGWEKENG